MSINNEYNYRINKQNKKGENILILCYFRLRAILLHFAGELKTICDKTYYKIIIEYFNNNNT